MFESINDAGDSNENSFSLLNYIINYLKPTKADLERVITKEEQIELCLKRKCRVDFCRWNPVYEYRLAFESKGRYQKWDHKKRLKMLAKSVNMMKPHEFVADDKIAEIRKNEWELQKKDSILSLDLWAYDRSKKNCETESDVTDNMSDSIVDCLEEDDIDEPERVDTETLDFIDLLGDVTEPHECVDNVNDDDDANVNDGFDLIDLLDDATEPRKRVQVNEEEGFNINSDISSDICRRIHVDTVNDDDANVNDGLNFIDLLGDGTEPHECVDNVNDDDANVNDGFDLIDLLDDATEPRKRVQVNEEEGFNINSDISSQPGQSKVVVDSDDVGVFCNVNTQSMSVDTHYLTQSPIRNCSEENPHMPANYTRFDNEVPLNSTQAPSFNL